MREIMGRNDFVSRKDNSKSGNLKNIITTLKKFIIALCFAKGLRRRAFLCIQLIKNIKTAAFEVWKKKSMIVFPKKKQTQKLQNFVYYRRSI